jgi:two-component system response regulator AlgR
VHTRGRDYLLEESLTKLEEEFVKRFVRIHRNALVAVDRIAGFEKGALPDAEGEAGVQWLVVLKDCAEKLPVSRRQWGTVKELARG